MITVSKEARTELAAYFEDKEKTPIRIYLAPGGCSGPRLALALDEPGEEDKSVEDNGLTFCMNTELLTSVGSVSITMSPMGFLIEPEIPLPGGGGGCCGSSGGGCGSGCGSSGGGCH